MHATTVESLEVIFREYGSPESSQPAPAQVDFDQDSVRAEARLWKPRVDSELNAKIEMILLLVLGALGLGAIGNAMDHVVTVLLRQEISTEQIEHRVYESCDGRIR
jgi:hypothetical protein